MIKNIKNFLKPIRDLAYRLFIPRFFEIKTEARGMLPPWIYYRLYKLATNLPDYDIVEIGGALGAGSISFAKGLQDANKSGKVIVIEKCEGGTRDAVGDYDANLNVITKNFAHFGVTEKIALFPHYLTFENSGEVLSLIETERIAAFMHDADGRIDRDFYVFWPYLIPNGTIIIDDYVDIGKKNDDAIARVGKKIVVTYYLLEQIIEWGLFVKDYQLKHTLFGHKPEHANFDAFDLGVCEEIAEQAKQKWESYR